MNVIKTNELIAVSQHGAMEYVKPPCNLDEVRLYRLDRIRKALVERDLAGIILYDQLNTRYATDSTNMQIWCSHNEARYVYVPAEGPTVLFEYGGKQMLSDGLPGVDRVRKTHSFFYFAAGDE